MSIHFVELAKKYITPLPTDSEKRVAIIIGVERMDFPEQPTLQGAKAQWADAHEVVKLLLMEGALVMRKHG